MKFNKNKFIKYSVLLLIIISVGVFINQTFNRPTKLNYLLASRVYKAPANKAFTDDNFYKCVIDAYNRTNSPDVAYTYSLTDEQLNKIEFLACSGYGKGDSEKITNVSGLEKLVSVKFLSLTSNLLSGLDLSNNLKLEEIYLGGSNKITNLDVSSNINLKILDLSNWADVTYSHKKGGGSDNSVQQLDLSNNILLQELYLTSIDLEQIVLPKNSELVFLNLENNKLTEIDLGNNIKLTEINLYNNNLTTLDASNLPNLIKIGISLNELTEINVSNDIKLEELYLGDNKLTSLDVSTLTELKTMYAFSNELAQIDVSNNKKLEKLLLDDNKLTSLDVSNLPNLSKMDASSNQLTQIDVSNNIKLEELYLGDNLLTMLKVDDLIELKELEAYNNKLENLDLSMTLNIKSIYIYGNLLKDVKFGENDNLKLIRLGDNKLSKIDVSTLTNLTTLDLGTYCTFNLGSRERCKNGNDLKEIDVSKNINLVMLGVSKNKLTEIDVSKNINLKELDISSNELIGIDIGQNVNLTTLKLYNNKLTEIDVSKNINLKTLDVIDNELTSIDVSQNSNLTKFELYSNNFTEKIGIYKGKTYSFSTELVKLPESKIINFEYTYHPIDKIGIYNNNIIFNETGEYKVNVRYEHNIQTDTNAFSILYNVYVIEATSDKYEINAEKGYIYTGIDTDEETILSNISLNYGGAVIEDNKVIIKYENEIVKEFNIVNITSDTYDLTKDYIFEYEDNSITINNGTINKNIENNTIEIKYGEDILETYKLVEATSEKYDLSNSTIKVQDNNINNFLESINCINCNSRVYDGTKYITEGDFTENNTFRIMYGEDVLKEYNLTFPVSGVTINKESVKLGLDRKNTIQLEAIINPKNAENKNISWTSSNEEVAIVDENGLVTSKGLGKTTITATTEDGGYTDTVEIEVANIITYKIIYKDGDKIYIENYEEDEIVKLKKDLIKEGYTLIGWKLDDKEYKLIDEFIMPAEDIELEVVWEANTYKVTYDYLDKTFDVTYDDEYGKLEIPTKKGYTFKGWYLEETYETEVKEDTIVKTAKNHTLYAKFEINSYKLIIDSNGGEYNGEKEITLNYNSPKEIFNPTRVGYTFKNWKLEGTESKIENNIFTMGISDSKLIANWELIIPNIEETSEYKVKKNIITGISLGTTIENLDLGLDDIYEVKIYNKKQELKTEGNIATNDKLKIYLGETLVSEYTLSVKGDVTGTGTSTVSDVAKLYQYLKKKIDMEDCYKEAGNVVSTDNDIKINDIAKLYQFIKKKISSLED